MANTPADITSQGQGEIYRAWLNNLGIPATSMGMGELLSALANAGAVENSQGRQLSPTNTIAATMGRGGVGSQTISLATGTLGMTAVYLVKGMVINNINYVSGSTAGAGLTHQWAGLYTGPASGPVLVAVTVDATSAAIGANAVITYALTAYTVPSSGLYYIGILVTNGTTQPTFAGSAAANVATATIPPILGGTSNTGLTTPQALATVATTITPTVNMIYSYLT